MSSHLDTLNPAQREAAGHLKGPLLVLAGAGAGKTRVIAHRILEIVRSGTAPKRILAITFTNKAGREMRERVEALLSKEPAARGEQSPFISTFHSLGLFIIKENYRELGFKRFPVVYDRSDSMRTIKQALKDAGAEGEIEPRMALSVISRNKGEGMTAAQFAETAQEPRARTIGEAWRRYERALTEDQALDFDDLLARAVALLAQEGRIRERYQNRWDYIHIDEYQDTNRIQGRMARFLLSPENNICAVGDIDQTIYTWRGADIRNIMQFEKEYPGARVVLLEENYRSTKAILSAANACIAKNRYRVDKKLYTRNEDGAPLSLYQAFNETDEAAFVARIIDELRERGAKPRDIAVLYRANFQSRAVEEALLGAGIPYQVLGTRFFERAEVKDAIAYLRASLFGSAADIARIANTPRRGIGKTTLLALLSNQEERLRADARKSVADFRALLERIGAYADSASPADALKFAIRESGIENMLRADKAEGAERSENLRELVALAGRYGNLPHGEGIQKFLEDAALASDQDEMKEDADAVRLMTVHASKGLEFPYVFITGLEEGLFPYSRGDENERDQEEERRLMYVALTRAQKKIYLSFASMRTIFGSQSMSEPSQFIADIPQELLELEAPERLGRTIYLE